MQTTPPDPKTTIACVHVIAGAMDDAISLVANLQGALRANNDFYLHPVNHQHFDTADIADHDAVLLLAPALSASNAEASQAQTAMMQLRQTLVARQRHFQLLFTQGAPMVDEALRALYHWFPDAPALQAHRDGVRAHGNLARWGWACDKCSDPECELRLFKGLIDPV